YRAALRGEKLQPPFYFLLGKRLTSPKEIQTLALEVEASFYYIAPRWTDGPLVTTSFNSQGFTGKIGEEIRNTISYLARGIQNGRFFIQPGEYCRHCDVAEICRKNHPPSLWRAENDPLTHPHRQLREKDPKKLLATPPLLLNLPTRPRGIAPSPRSTITWLSLREREPAKLPC